MEDFTALFLLLIILVAFFSPLIFDDRVFFSGDFTLITYPIKSFLSQIYHLGAVPLWTESIVHGAPFMESYHPGVFYPPSLLFLMDDVTLALNLFYLLHFIILAWSVYILGRSCGMSAIAALCSAVTAMLSGFILGSTLLSNFFLAAVWLPSIFYFFQNYLRKKRLRDFLGAVFVLACQVLAACPEISLMTVLLLFFYTALPGPGKNALWERLRPVTALAGMVALALGLSALQLYPTYKMVQLSARSGGLPFEIHALWSMQFGSLPSILLPQDFTDYLRGDQTAFQFLESFYMGAFAVIFLCLGILFLRERSIRFWTAVFFAGIFFALGSHNPVYRYFFDWLPLVDLFRYPEKFFYMSAFALIFLTGFSLDAVARAALKKKIHCLPVITVLLFVFAGAGLAALYKSGLSPYLAFLLLPVFGLLYLMLYFGKVGEAPFKALILILILFDLASHGYRIIPMIDKGFFEREPAFAKEIKKDKDPNRVYTGRIQNRPDKFTLTNGPSYFSATLAAKEYLYPYMGMIYGVEHPDSVPGVGLELSDHKLWREALISGDPEKRRRILARSNVKYWVDVDTPTPYRNGFPIILPGRMQVLEGALPRAFLVNKARFATGPRLLDIYYSESFDPRDEVILSQQAEWKAEENFTGTVEEIKYSPNHVVIQTVQSGAGFLVLLDSYFPGWKVIVDGEEGQVLQANHFFRAVKLGPGRHTLEFSYMPGSFKTGLAVTSATFLLIVLASAWRCRKKT